MQIEGGPSGLFYRHSSAFFFVPMTKSRTGGSSMMPVSGFYTAEEVQTKLAEHREAIAKAELEVGRLRGEMANRGLSTAEAELLRQELKALRDRNLWESTFAERANLVAKLGIKILPSEDLQSRKIFCRLNLAKVNQEREQAGFAKMTFGGAEVSIGSTVGDFDLTFRLSF